MPSRWKAHFDLTLISHSAHNTRPCHSVNYDPPWLNCRVSTTWLFVLPICTLRCAGALYCRLCPVLYSSFYSLALIINVPFVYKRSSCFYHKSILCFSLYVLKQACKQKIISSSSCSAQKFMIMWARYLVTSGKWQHRCSLFLFCGLVFRPDYNMLWMLFHSDLFWSHLHMSNYIFPYGSCKYALEQLLHFSATLPILSLRIRDELTLNAYKHPQFCIMKFTIFQSL